MTDRELLELAGKAAGLRVVFPITKDGAVFPMCDSAEDGLYRWNPRDDDGDALRLAIQLRMSVNVGPTEACVETLPWALRGELMREEFGQDAAAAVRRAILRAAAKLGDSMP